MADKKKFKNPLSLQIDPALFETATDEEKAQQVTMRESVSFMKDAMRRLRKNKMASSGRALRRRAAPSPLGPARRPESPGTSLANCNQL